MARLLVCRRISKVCRNAAGIADGAGCCDAGAHGRQGTAHIGMVQDRGGAIDARRLALLALLRVFERRLISRLAHGNALKADIQPRRVHHREHAGQALVGFADQPARGAVILHHAGGGGVDTDLLFQADTFQAVAFAEAAVFTHEEFRHQEQRHAARPGRRIRQARQDQVDDVLGDVMVAPGDEDLLAADRVGAVIIRHGLGLQCADIGAGLRLGQVHRAGPVPGDEVRQIGLLLRVGAMRQQSLNRTEAEHRAEAKRHIRRVDHLHHGQRQRLGQALSAPFLRRRQAHPAAFTELGIGLCKAGRSLDAILCQHSARRVARLVQRRQHIAGKLCGLVQNRCDQIRIVGLEARQALQLWQAGNRLQREGHVLDRGFIGHQFISDSA